MKKFIGIVTSITDGVYEEDIYVIEASTSKAAEKKIRAKNAAHRQATFRAYELLGDSNAAFFAKPRDNQLVIVDTITKQKIKAINSWLGDVAALLCDHTQRRLNLSQEEVTDLWSVYDFGQRVRYYADYFVDENNCI